MISGNAGAGVTVVGQSTSIRNNYIGTNAAGTADLGNTGHGINLSGFGSHAIGGAGSQFRNFISGNDGSGIYTNGSAFNTIQGNYIGLNASGTAAIGNGTAGQNTSGISINGGTPQFIGGTAAGEGNVISGNLGNKAGGYLVVGLEPILDDEPLDSSLWQLDRNRCRRCHRVGQSSCGHLCGELIERRNRWHDQRASQRDLG